MAEHDKPRREPPQPDEGSRRATRQAGDRPLPTPGHVGHLPDDAPGPGKPVVYPPREPEE